MTHFKDEQEFQAFLANRNPGPDYFKMQRQESDTPESALQSKIRDWAKIHGYPCLMHPQNKKLSWFIPPGYPDVVLSLPYGHTLYLELKSVKGIWKEKQRLIFGQLNQLGHQYHIVRSWKGFLEIVEKVQRRE